MASIDLSKFPGVQNHFQALFLTGGFVPSLVIQQGIDPLMRIGRLIF